MSRIPLVREARFFAVFTVVLSLSWHHPSPILSDSAGYIMVYTPADFWAASYATVSVLTFAIYATGVEAANRVVAARRRWRD